MRVLRFTHYTMSALHPEYNTVTETSRNWCKFCQPLTYKMYKTSVYTLVNKTFKDLHIENSKNCKRWYCLHHTDCV